MNEALLRRLGRAVCLVRAGYIGVTAPIIYWEPDSAEHIISVSFTSKSQSNPKVKYGGELYFDRGGQVIHAECECQDHWQRAAGSEWTAAHKNGEHRCKHDLAAEMVDRVGALSRQEYPAGHVFYRA